jgi:hypothetical protein
MASYTQGYIRLSIMGMFISLSKCILKTRCPRKSKASLVLAIGRSTVIILQPFVDSRIRSIVSFPENVFISLSLMDVSCDKFGRMYASFRMLVPSKHLAHLDMPIRGPFWMSSRVLTLLVYPTAFLRTALFLLPESNSHLVRTNHIVLTYDARFVHRDPLFCADHIG